MTKRNLVAAMALALATVTVGATPRYSERPRLVYPGVSTGFPAFGQSVAMTGDRIVVGAPDAAVGSVPGAGEVAIYARSGRGWTLEAQLQGSVIGEARGRSVAISGDTVVAGNNGYACGNPQVDCKVSVYRLLNGSWILEAELINSGSYLTDHFGTAVAIDGDTLAVSAPDMGASGNYGGSIFIFRRTGSSWTETQRLSVATNWVALGTSLALQGNTLVAGAPNEGADKRGAVYVFTRPAPDQPFVQAARLVASDAAAYDYLGSSVALAGSRIVAGAPCTISSSTCTARGYAYVYDLVDGSWTETARLRAAETTGSDHFGASVAIADQRVIVGAPWDSYGVMTAGGSVTYNRAGSVYVYEGGQLVDTLRSSSPNAQLGTSAAAFGPELLVGGPQTSSTRGAAWIYGPYFKKGDLDGDGNTDLLFANAQAPELELWLMNGWTRTGAAVPLPSTAGPNGTLAVAGVDDFDGDGQNDLLMWDGVTGATEVWFMNGSERLSVQPLSTTLTPPWKPSAVADFNKDGCPDIIWRNYSTQKLVVWTMNGAVRTGQIVPNPDQAVASNWEIVGAIDLNNDSFIDLLWYNWSSGKIVYWTLRGDLTRITGAFTAPPNAGQNNWKVLATGDYGNYFSTSEHYGAMDLVWRNADSGRVVVWTMDFTGTREYGAFVTPDASAPATSWTVAGPR